MEDKRGGGQIGGIDSVYMSSDDADSMRETRLDYKNNTGVSGIQRVLSASPPHDTHAFHQPQLPSEFQSKDFQKFQERRRSSSLDSISKSSDFAPLSQSAQETPDVTCSIRVSSLPPNISDELINDFFENTKRSGGGDVECVAYDETKKTAIITFQDPSVVESVLKKHKTEPLTMDEMQLQIEEYHQKTVESTGKVDVAAVKVTNLPPKIRKLQIELFFESPKKSGSSNEDLEKVDYDEATHCAIVWFKKSEVVTKVLEKHKTSPFMLNKQRVEVEEYRPSVDEYESSSKDEEEGVIEVTNIPSKTTEEELVLFFENRKKSGGGDVEKVEYNRSTHMAVIWFKKEDAASRVLKKCPLLLRKKQIHVQKMHLNAKKVGKKIDQESSGSFCTTCIKGKIISDDVQWYYVDNSEGKNELVEYPGNMNLIIEKAYRNQDKEVRFMDDGGTEYTINFNNMEEYPTVDKSDVITVTRRDKIKDTTFEPPSEWTTMNDSDNLLVVPVKSSDPGYSNIIDRFHGQVGKTEIVRSERTQNSELGLQNKLQAKLISDNAQWYFVDDYTAENELIEYPDNINLIIEKAYRNQDKEVKFADDGGTEYAINFNNMTEYPTVDKTDITTVIRRVKTKESTFEHPAELPVKSNEPEYFSVLDGFHGQVGKREIVQLERIQNKLLYQQYVGKKKLLESLNPKGTKNERELWHGTAPEAVSSINSLGFNRSYCVELVAKNGEGVDFAVDARCSASDTYPKPDGQGHKRMYLCKVLTGEYTVGQSGMRVPPAKQGQQSHILYDSVVNDSSNPLYFTIFNDTQCYPAYLITFK